MGNSVFFYRFVYDDKGIENLNIINMIGDKLIKITSGKFDLAVIAVTWLAGFTSIIGNVANAATVSLLIFWSNGAYI